MAPVNLRSLKMWKKKASVTQNAPTVSSKPFKVADFKSRYYDLRSEVEFELEQEFREIEKTKGEKQTFYHGSKIENDHKNRYKNIIPFDHCRVKLHNRNYFNGSYVHGQNSSKDFIVTQAPLFETVNDFWSMVWQQETGTIVNLAKHVEGGKERGMVYWPEEGEKRYGKITVTKISKRKMSFFNYYTFAVVNSTGDHEDRREVVMFHFLGWPISGVPQRSTELTTFIYNIRYVESLRPNKEGPMVCHCSGGTGRTGTFIGIWNSLDQLIVSDILDLYRETVRLRSERTKLIFTLVQYKFLHRAVLEVVSSVDYQQLKQADFCLDMPLPPPTANTYQLDTSPTNISVESSVSAESTTASAVGKTTEKEDLSLAKKRVSPSAEIKRPVPEELFERYMELLTENNDEMLTENFSFIEKFDHVINNSCFNGFKKENGPKNRYRNILPFDHSRVKLAIKGGNMDSDYINANYVHGYNAPRAFIATQAPLPETIEDFWAMVWDQNSKTIVNLTKVEERGKIRGLIYWPWDGATMEYGNVEILSVKDKSCSGFTMHTLEISNIHEEGKRKIVLFNYISWPESSVPETPSNFLTFIYNIRYVESLRPNKEGPMVCHCSGGTGRTGTFIGIWNSLDRLTCKNDLDLLCLVGQMRQQRRKIVFNSVQYKFLHQAMLMVVTKSNLKEIKSAGFALPIGRVSDEMKLSNILSSSALNLNGFRRVCEAIGGTIQRDSSLALDFIQDAVGNQLPWKSSDGQLTNEEIASLLENEASEETRSVHCCHSRIFGIETAIMCRFM